MEWHEITNSIRTADVDGLRKLRCPECGGQLRIEFVKTDQKSALYVDCLQCKQRVRTTGTGVEPPWTKELGFTATTG